MGGFYAGCWPAIQRAALVNLGELTTYDTAKKNIASSSPTPKLKPANEWARTRRAAPRRARDAGADAKGHGRVSRIARVVAELGPRGVAGAAALTRGLLRARSLDLGGLRSLLRAVSLDLGSLGGSLRNESSCIGARSGCN